MECEAYCQIETSMRYNYNKALFIFYAAFFGMFCAFIGKICLDFSESLSEDLMHQQLVDAQLETLLPSYFSDGLLQKSSASGAGVSVCPQTFQAFGQAGSCLCPAQWGTERQQNFGQGTYEVTADLCQSAFRAGVLSGDGGMVTVLMDGSTCPIRGAELQGSSFNTISEPRTEVAWFAGMIKECGL